MTYGGFFMSGSTTASTTPAPRAPATVVHAFPDGSRLDLQVNFCKNPNCPNYGVPVTGHKRVRYATVPGATGPGYNLMSGGSGPGLKCKGCGEFPPLKSNQGIVEELARISKRFEPAEAASCPNKDCKNSHLPLGDGSYKKAGKTS